LARTGVAFAGHALLIKADKSVAAFFKRKNQALARVQLVSFNFYFVTRGQNVIKAFNTLKDFAFDSKVAGAISMSNPLTSGTAMAAATALKDKYGYEYFTALGQQKVMVESGSVALTKLQTGECKVIMILEESILKVREEDGSKLEVIYPTDGTITVPSTIMTVEPTKWSANNNVKACEAITDWYLSKAGQDFVVKGWMHSVRKDYPNPPFDAVPTTDSQNNQMPVNWENCYKQREEIRMKFQEAVMKK
jgi:iron(III) transport system substrate-binding protein